MSALLPAKVLSVMSSVKSLKMPPPQGALLRSKELSVTASMPTIIDAATVMICLVSDEGAVRDVHRGKRVTIVDAASIISFIAGESAVRDVQRAIYYRCRRQWLHC